MVGLFEKSDRAMERLVALGDGEQPWGDDRTCPRCGATDLPLQRTTPTKVTGMTFHYIAHCGGAWMRGPITYV